MWLLIVLCLIVLCSINSRDSNKERCTFATSFPHLLCCSFLTQQYRPNYLAFDNTSFMLLVLRIICQISIYVIKWPWPKSNAINIQLDKSYTPLDCCLCCLFRYLEFLSIRFTLKKCLVIGCGGEDKRPEHSIAKISLVSPRTLDQQSARTLF